MLYVYEFDSLRHD